MEFDKELLAKAVPIPELEHFGVKGMKWGVRRKSTSDKSGTTKEPGKIRQELSSFKREVSTRKDLKNVSKLTEKQLKSKTERLRSENELKRLTKDDTYFKKSSNRDEYLKRAKLSDSELKSRVERLRLEDALKQQIKSANKDNVDVANKIIRESAKIAISAYTGTTGVMVADTIIKESLNYAKSNNVIKQSAIPDKYKQMTF